MLTELAQYVGPIYFWKIQIQEDEIGARRVTGSPHVIDELKCLGAISNDVQLIKNVVFL